MGQQRKLYQSNAYEKKLLKTIFIYASIPLIFIILFYYVLLYDLINAYIQSGLADNLLPQFIILSSVICIYYLILYKLVYRFVNRLAGFYPRILRQLDDIINTNAHAHLKLRDDDYGQELMDRINQLIDKAYKK